MRRYLSWLAVLWLLLGLWVPGVFAQVPAAAVPSATLPQIRLYPQQLVGGEAVNPQLESLFYRKPWSFEWGTFEALWNDIQGLLPWAHSTLIRLQNQDFVLSDYLLVGGLVLVLLIFLSLGWMDRRFQKLLNPLLNFLPRAWPLPVRHLTRLAIAVLSRSLIFLSALFLTYLVWGAFSPQSRLFPSLIHLLWIAVIYRTLHLLILELLANPDNQLFDTLSRPLALHLYRRLRFFLIYIAFFLAGISLFEYAHYRSDFIDFLYFVFSGGLLLFGAYLVANKSQIFALLPTLDEPFYLRFLDLLGRFYTWVMAFTLALGVLWIVGYHHLAQIFFLRSWVLVALFLGAALFHRWQAQKITEAFSPTGKLSSLGQQLAFAIVLIEVFLVSQLFLYLLDIRNALLQWLASPIASIGNSSLSLLSIFSGGLTVVIFWLCSRILNALLEDRIFPRLSYDAAVQQMITLSIFYISMGLGGLIGLNIMGLDLSMFAIFAGAMAFGIGFGLQGIAKNFASGIVLVFSGLVKKGDYITVGDYTGYIQQVSWKKVLLRTPDHVDLIVPTVSMVESTIVNWTYSDERVRVHLPVGVAYNADLEIAKTALLEAAAEHPEVLAEPAPVVWLKEFGDSALQLELLVWIDCERITLESLRGEINFMIWQALKRHQIEIAFPQRDLHLRSGWPPIDKPAEP